MPSLFLVGRYLSGFPVRGDGHVRWKRNCGGVPAAHVGALPQRRYRGGYDAFRKIFIIDISYIIGFKSSSPLGHVQVFTPLHQASNLSTAMMMRFIKVQSTIHVSAVVVGICKPVQIAADYGLWLGPLGHADGFKSAFFADPCETADKVYKVRPESKKLRHPSIVVILLRYVAIGALLGFLGSHGVGDMRVKSLAAKSRRGNRRLLDINARTIAVF